MTNAFMAMALVMVTLVSLIHVLSLLAKTHHVKTELLRKSLHVLMGTLTLTFPWLFQEAWPVVTLSIISSLFISLIKTSNMKEWGPVVCTKGRKSIGEICFPLAVGLLFVLADGNKLFYLIPVAILTYADAGSALIGMRFGKNEYLTADGIKTTEGSITFAIIAFFASLVALSSLSSLSQPDILLMSGVIALLAMLFEAIAWRGLDNIFIPVGSFFALQTHFHLTGQPLLIRLVILLAMASVLIVTRRKTTLEGSAVLAVVLFCYFAFVYGGMIWALSPALLYGSYRLLLPARFHNLTNSHSIYAVISVASAGLLWLLFASHHDAPQYLFPYSLAFAAHAAIISIAHMRFTGLDKPKVYAILFASLKAWCLLCLPFVILTPTSKLITLTFCLAPFCIAIPAMAFYLANSRHQVATDRPTRWIKQAIFAGLGSLIGLMPLVL